MELTLPIPNITMQTNMNKPKPTNKVMLKDCAAKRKRIECAKDTKLQHIVLAARATSNERWIIFKVL